ncbi:MAG: hypothetical protein K8R53_10000 [Bacteroidales bacterium]|nr:hypothetical protein [Bacteroidales bacterium]
MNGHRLSTNIVYLFLRVAVLVFIIPFYKDILPGHETDVGSWTTMLKNLLIILYVGLVIITFILSNSRFELYGFSVVLSGSIYKFLVSLIENGINGDLSIYFFTSLVSVYFLHKNLKKKKGRRISIF